MMQKTLAAKHEQDMSGVVKQIWQALGLGNLKEKIVRVGLADSGLTADAYVSLAGPRQGLMALLHPVKTDVFKVVDANAIEAFAWNWDMAGTYDLVLKTAQQLGKPQDFNDFQQGLARTEQQLGLSIRRDLLEPLSGPMVVYNMPPGSPQAGTVELGTIGGVSLAAGILMPALARTRQPAFRMTSGTNLAGIGKACLIYANDHDDRYPPSLDVLVQEGYLDAKVVTSKMRRKDAKGPDYLYISGQTTADNPSNILAYDNPEGLKSEEGVNVLYGDSHVQYVKMDEFKKQLDETTQRLGRKGRESSNNNK